MKRLLMFFCFIGLSVPCVYAQNYNNPVFEEYFNNSPQGTNQGVDLMGVSPNDSDWSKQNYSSSPETYTFPEGFVPTEPPQYYRQQQKMGNNQNYNQNYNPGNSQGYGQNYNQQNQNAQNQFEQMRNRYNQNARQRTMQEQQARQQAAQQRAQAEAKRRQKQQEQSMKMFNNTMNSIMNMQNNRNSQRKQNMMRSLQNNNINNLPPVDSNAQKIFDTLNSHGYQMYPGSK